jgi:predicted Zn-ribbon and HTH transcriptional regulator
MGIIHPTQIVACEDCGIIYWRASNKTTNTDRCPYCDSKNQVQLDWKTLVSKSKK